MGAAKQYNPSGGFYEYEYHQVGETIHYDGLQGKVIVKNNLQTGLPPHSGKSDFYANIDAETGKIIQLRLNRSRASHIDFDWGHEHKNLDGSNLRFSEGIVHVHTYEKGKRNRIARYMNNDEIKRFGALLKSLNPDVKFRP